MQEQTKGTLQMMLCAVLWSFGGVLIKLIPWNPLAIAGARSLIAAITIYCCMRAMKVKFYFNRRTIWIAVALAGIATSFVAATKLTTAANAIVIQYTGPLYLLLFNAIFRHQKFHVADWLVVLLTVLGIGVFFLDKIGGGTAIGNLVAMAAGIFFAAMFITTGDAGNDERLSGILQGQVLTALIGMPVWFATGAQITLSSGLCILGLGVVQIGLAYVLYAVAMKTCSPLACSVLAALEPLLNPVWVFLFAGEQPGVLSLVGGGIVIVSVTIWCVWNGRRGAVEKGHCAAQESAI